ncbi:MAG: Ig-like domain-containing protein [Lachnospiraceae bacterium]
MMKYGKKLTKRLTAFLMSVVMVMTLVMSVEPMEVRAATTRSRYEITEDYYDLTANDCPLKVGDIFSSGAQLGCDHFGIGYLPRNDCKYHIFIDNSRHFVLISNHQSYNYITTLPAGYNYEVTGLTKAASYEWRIDLKKLVASVKTAPSAATNLSYTASAQDLLSSNGSADNGSMVFRLGTSGDFTDTIPQAINAGSYKVYYKAKGTGNYADSAASYVTVTIATASPTSPTTPTVSSVSYGTKLSEISLGTDWSWENGNTVPDVGNTGYTAVYNKTLDTANYDWSSVAGYDSASGKIKRKIVVPVTPIPKPEASFTVPTNLSATYNSSKTLNSQISLPANWAWKDGSVIPKVSDEAFEAVYTVPSPDNQNYTWDNIDGYAVAENGTITITRDLPVTISNATQTAPVVTATDEEKFGQENGKINGVTTDMEYRKAGATDYTQINDSDLTSGSLTGLAPGTYYVRYKAKTNYDASPDTSVTIGEGTKLSVTFPTESVRSAAGYEISYNTNPNAIKWQEDYTFSITLTDGFADALGGVTVKLDGTETLLPQIDNTVSEAPVYTYTIPDMEADHTVSISGITHYTDLLEIENDIAFGACDYGDTPDAKAIVIKNRGNRKGAIKSVTVSGNAFNITGSETTVPKDGSLQNAYTIRPRANKAVGDYSETITVTYYKDVAHTIEAAATKTVTYTVQPKSLNPDDITIVNPVTNEPVFYYTAKPVTVALKDSMGNIIDASEYTVSYENNTAVSTSGHPAKVTITDALPGSGDYTIAETTKNYVIKYLDTSVSAAAAGEKKNNSGWFTGDVTLAAPEGYTINTSNSSADSGWSSTLSVTEEGVTQKDYYLKRTLDGAITDKKTATVKIDKTSPNATFTVGDNAYTTFVEPGDISFDNVWDTTKRAEIVASDNGSGSVKRYYYFADTPVAEENISGVTGWKEYTGAVTTPEGRHILYVKAVDGAGNTTYLSSQGINVDTQAPVISNVTDKKTYCETKTVKITDTNLDKVYVNDEEVTLSGDEYTLVADGTTYKIVAIDKGGRRSSVTVTVKNGHTSIRDEREEPTCTETGLTEGSHCLICGEILVEQGVIPALGHDWTGEWKVTTEATKDTKGRKELTCSRPGCNQKRFDVIPELGTEEEPEDPNAGKIQKDAEVADDSPISEATFDNNKSELSDAPAIFTPEEKAAIEGGSDARVWLEITGTDVNSIPASDRANIENVAKSIMGNGSTITYFDADLFKQIVGGEKVQIHEPGIAIRVTIKIPTALLNTDKTIIREYKVIRLHKDETTGESLVDVLNGSFHEATGEFSFATDRFSTYAIVYTDIKPVTGVTLTPESATLTKKGETLKLTATITPEDATDKSVTWSSSNTEVATVDENGNVTAVGNGKCDITVTTNDGGMTASSTITVDLSGKTMDKVPNTGDAGNPAGVALVMLISMIALTGLYTVRRRKFRI